MLDGLRWQGEEEAMALTGASRAERWEIAPAAARG
jgi:hypothetical protein